MLKVIQNPDKEFVKEVHKKLKQNNGYCPCRLVKNEDAKCICKEFRDAIEVGKVGKCHCGLYELIEVE